MKNKENETNGTSLRKYKVLLAVLGAGLLLVLVSLLLSKGETDNPPQLEEAEHTEKQANNGTREEGEPLHEHLGPVQEETDPFEGGEKEFAAIHSLSFQAPKRMQYIKPDETVSTLVDAQGGFFLFDSFGDVGQVYHEGYGEIGTLGMDVTHASACTNKEFVGFSSAFETTKHKIFSYDINNGFKNELFAAGKDEQIVAVICDNTRIYFTVQEANGNMRTQMVALSAYVNDLKPSDTYLVVKGSSPHLVRNQQDVFVYVPKKNILKAMNDLGIDHDIPISFQEETSQIVSFDLNEANRWISVYVSGDDQSRLALDGKRIEAFQSVTKADWYDERYIAVLDFNALYLYDTEHNTKALVSDNVSSFVLLDGSIYIEDTVGTLSVLNKKVEE